MKNIILTLLTVFLVTGLLVVDSRADCSKRHRGFWAGPAMIVSPRPYYGYYYPPPPVLIHQPAPVVIRQPVPVVYPAPPWPLGISVFLPAISVRIR